jgi:hypothetical protein
MKELNKHINTFIDQLLCENLFKIKEQTQKGIIMQLKENIKFFDSRVKDTIQSCGLEFAQYSDTYSRSVDSGLERQDSEG